MSTSSVLRAAFLALVSASPTLAQTLVGTGSGFLVNDAGWVMTNAHVVEGCDLVREEGLGDATTVIEDAEADLAVVLFTAARGGTPLALRKTPVRLTEDIVALGYPLSDILGNAIRATTGSVSSLAGIQGDARYIQISAPIQPGNSGGPVLDEAGNVLGLATGVLSEETFDHSQNVNFAVTAAEAVRFLTDNGLTYVRPRVGAVADDDVDVVARATESTFLLQCLAETPVAPVSPPVPDTPRPFPVPETVSENPAEMVTYDGLDVLGFDYRTIRDVSLSSCQSSCEGDRECRAYTYNTRYGVCFLKSDAMVLVENDNAAGGYDADLTDDIIDSGLMVSSDVDSPGGDYRRLRGSSYIECTLECGIDLQCQAFAFVRDTADCWLKDSVGRLESVPGVEFGLRR